MKKWMKYLMITTGGLGLVGCNSQSSIDTSLPSELNDSNTEVVESIETTVEVDFWHSMSGNTETALKNLVESFNKGVGAEKGIIINPIYQGSYDDLKSKTTAAIKASETPGIAQAYSTFISEYLQANVVEPLNDYIFDKEIGIQDFEDIYEAYRKENSQYTDEEIYYSLPFNKSTEVLFYNKTFFEEYDLRVPITWDDMEVLSQKIYELTGNPTLGIDSTANYFITMVKQYGGDYTSSNGAILFGENDAALKALELFDRNVEAGYWRLAGEDKYISTPFVNGTLPMYIGSSNGASYVYNDLFEWDSAPIPQISDETKTIMQQGSNVVIFNQNKTPEEIYAAYEFAKYLCSYEGNLQWVQETGYLPVRQSVVKSAEYKTYVETSGDTTKLTGPQQASAYYYDPAFFTDTYSANQVRTEVGVAVEQVVFSQIEPEIALENLLNLFK